MGIDCHRVSISVYNSTHECVVNASDAVAIDTMYTNYIYVQQI